MKITTDVAIIGGGIISCSLAYQLRKHNIPVAVLEQGSICAQASSAATGMLAPFKLYAKQDDTYLALQRASMSLFPDLIAELKEVTGIDCEYQETGTIRIADGKQQDKLTAWAKEWNDAGVVMDVLNCEDLLAIEPSLSPEHVLAISIPSEPQLKTNKFIAAMEIAARYSGACLLEECKIVAVQHHPGGSHTLFTKSGDSIACKRIVIAAGCWSVRMSHLFGRSIEVRPLQGQSIAIKQPEVSVQHMIFGGPIYIAPKQDRTVIVGATNDEVGFNLQATQEATQFLFEEAKKLVPALQEKDIMQSFVGLRPRTPDHKPIIGEIAENVYVATGHNGFGILLSSVTACTLTELLLTGRTPEIIHPFSIERFLVEKVA